MVEMAGLGVVREPFGKKIYAAVRGPAAQASWRAVVPLAVLFVLVLAGCTMIPKYQQPSTPMSSSWPGVPGYAKTQTAPAQVAAADIGWRNFFRDPRLRQLIEMALTNNPDLEAAIENVEQSRQLYHVQAAQLVPVVSATGTGTRQRVPNVYQTGTNSVSAITYSEFTASLGVTSYELDLFGQVRSLKREALETYFANVEARKSAQIALVSEVATAYLTEQEAAEQLALAREMLNAAKKSFALTQSNFVAGVDSQFDLNSASAQVQTASASEANYAQQLAEASDNLNFLMGRPVPADLLPPQSLDLGLCMSDIPSGLPSDLLEQRPDILEAEHQLKSQNANIGAARAAFFPTITLTGSGGYASTKLSDLFEPGSAAWNFSPEINWPIFAMGTAYHELKADQAEQRIAVANYQTAVQTAFREVADDLAVRATVQSQLADDQALVNADQQSYDLTQAGFRSGVNSALDVLVTLQTLDSARQNLIQVQYNRLVSLINLYQALGGGWSEQTVQSGQSSQR